MWENTEKLNIFSLKLMVKVFWGPKKKKIRSISLTSCETQEGFPKNKKGKTAIIHLFFPPLAFWFDFGQTP